MLSHTDPYMDWRPMAAHADGCKRTGWDVRRCERESYGGSRDIGVRAICPETGGCGVVVELMFHLADERDPDTQDLRSGESYSGGHVDRIGYGTKPTKIGGVWLHAGPPFAAFSWATDDGPEWWYVTRSETPPASCDETLGKIFRLRKDGRQLKGRFGAGAGWKRDRYASGELLRERRDDLTSRTAAARWVEQRAAELAAGGEGR